MEFLCLSKETWQFINSFADWFSAIGTIAAVVVALYLARTSQRINLRVTVGHKVAMPSGYKGPLPEYVSIEVTNMGPRVVRVTYLDWRGGIFRTIEAAQAAPTNCLSSSLPIELADSQQARWMIPLDPEERFIDNFIQIFLTSKWFWRIQLRAIHLRVSTSTGYVHTTRLNRQVITGLTKHYRSHRGE